RHRRTETLQAEGRPRRKAHRRGAVRGASATARVGRNGRRPPGQCGGAAPPARTEDEHRTSRRRLDSGGRVPIGPSSERLEGLKGAGALTTDDEGGPGLPGPGRPPGRGSRGG